MTRKSGLQILLAVGLLALAVIQFIPSAPVVPPVAVPPAERDAAEFTPEYRRFMQQVLAADGAAVAWYCTAGKDRSGFAAPLLLRDGLQLSADDIERLRNNLLTEAG